MSFWASELMQDTSRATIAGSVDKTTSDGQEQNRFDFICRYSFVLSKSA